MKGGSGWVAVPRVLFSDSDPLWTERRPRTRFECWMDLLQLAAFADHEMLVGGVVVHLQRGQVAASERMLAKRWQFASRGRVRRVLQTLERLGRIHLEKPQKPDHQPDHQTDHPVTIVTILDYNTYAAGIQPSGPPNGPPNGPLADHRRTNHKKAKKGEEGKRRAERHVAPSRSAPVRGRQDFVSAVEARNREALVQLVDGQLKGFGVAEAVRVCEFTENLVGWLEEYYEDGLDALGRADEAELVADALCDLACKSETGVFSWPVFERFIVSTARHRGGHADEDLPELAAGSDPEEAPPPPPTPPKKKPAPPPKPEPRPPSRNGKCRIQDVLLPQEVPDIAEAISLQIEGFDVQAAQVVVAKVNEGVDRLRSEAELEWEETSAAERFRMERTAVAARALEMMVEGKSMWDEGVFQTEWGRAVRERGPFSL